MSRPRLLLVPFFTELEFEMTRPRIDEWGETVSFDPPGVGDEPGTPDLREETLPDLDADELLRRYREAVARRGIEEADRAGWDRFFVAADSYGNASAVRVAELAEGRVEGVALGHATLSRSAGGERPTIVKEVFDAMGQMLRTDREAFIAVAVSQLTQGAVDPERAQRWLERMPASDIVSRLWDAFGETEEPIGERLEQLSLPLLAGEHVGCLVETREGFEDFVAAFPEARTVACPQACLADPAFAEALRDFCSAD